MGTRRSGVRIATQEIELLTRIETKLSALLVIAVDEYLRETDVARPKPRSIDRMLADVGISQKEIAALLGKTPQAVSLALGKDKPKAAKRSKVEK